MHIEPHTYISLWPNRGRKGFFQSALQKMTMNVKRRPLYRDYAADLAEEEFEPVVVELHSLQETLMQTYWEKVQSSELEYELTEFNCSTIIANALYIGSGKQPTFQPLADIDTYIGLGMSLGQIEAWEPKHVLHYAKELQAIEVQQQKG